MKTSELLDHTASVLLDDRADLLEGESDSLWKDETIVRYLNDAQEKLCRWAWVLEDKSIQSIDQANNKICEITLKEGRTDYSVSKSIIRIKSVRLSDSDVDLRNVSYDDNRVIAYGNNYADYWDVNQISIASNGRPRLWSADMGNKVLKVRNAPDTATALLKLHLVVVRMPVKPLSVRDMEREPEVDPEYHLRLCEYAAAKCLESQTVDADRRQNAKDWLAEFDEEMENAYKEKIRFQMGPGRFTLGGRNGL